MNAPDFNAAAAFVANARVLDRRRFQRLFEDGPAAPVRDALAAYRNDDGGFGHALEPDCRAPGSQPAAADMALRILNEANAWDENLVRGACGWLAAVAPAEGGVRPGRPADPGAEPGGAGSGGTRRGARRARLRARTRLAGPRPVRRRDGRGAPGPPGPGPAGRRRLDVQLAGLVAGRRAGLARLPHGRRPPRPARQPSPVGAGWGGRVTDVAG